MTAGAAAVAIAGGDTAEPRNLAKRVALVARLAGPLDGRVLLDGGCGGGAYARAYAGFGARVLGLEYARDKLRCAPRGASLAAGDLEHLPVASASVDVAVLNEVLEHVPSDLRALGEVRRVLREGGVLVVMSPNRLYPFESHGVKLARSGADLPLHTPFVPYLPAPLARRFLSFWARNYWPWELRRRVREAGFAVERTGYLAQTFENVSGRQSRWLERASPGLRAFAAVAEALPGVRALCCVSQWIAARPVTRQARRPDAAR